MVSIRDVDVQRLKEIDSLLSGLPQSPVVAAARQHVVAIQRSVVELSQPYDRSQGNGANT